MEGPLCDPCLDSTELASGRDIHQIIKEKDRRVAEFGQYEWDLDEDFPLDGKPALQVDLEEGRVVFCRPNPWTISTAPEFKPRPVTCFTTKVF